MKLTKITDLFISFFVFVVVIDPLDSIFKLKMPLFALCVLLLIIRNDSISYKSVLIIIGIYSICLISNIAGFLRDINTDLGFALGVYKGFTMTILLLWANKLKILEYLYFPTVLISIVIVFIFIFIKTNPDIGGIIYKYSRSEQVPIKISSRNFIGFEILSVFYHTSPLCIFVAGVFLQKLTKGGENNFTNLFICASAISVLILSGTRMNMLSAVIITGFILIRKIWRAPHGKVLAGLISIVGIFTIMVIINLLISDKGEQSLEVKSTLAKSFNIQVTKDPWLLLLGEGPGATFDSLGVRGKYAVQSELTYLDLIRWFGIPFTITILLIYLYPIRVIYHKRKKLEYSSILIIAYVLYMFIAGTNPLLITSTGMIALLVMYTYAFNPYYEKKRIEI